MLSIKFHAPLSLTTESPLSRFVDKEVGFEHFDLELGAQIHILGLNSVDWLADAEVGAGDDESLARSTHRARSSLLDSIAGSYFRQDTDTWVEYYQQDGGQIFQCNIREFNEAQFASIATVATAELARRSSMLLGWAAKHREAKSK